MSRAIAGPTARAAGRLVLLVVCIGLVTSRLGLVVHEFAGHGGAALAVGGEVTDVHLFALAGGWIRYRLLGGDGLVVALGGIAVESVIGTALWLGLARRPPTLGTRIARAIGCALVIHAAWYLATGTWHGYGDGTLLYRELGEARWIVAVPAGLVACTMAYAGARLVIGALAATLPRERRLAVAALVFVIAGAVQLAGAVAEVRLRRDTTYAQTMTPERERIVARELAAWERDLAARGAQASAEARRRMEAELAAKAAVFPFIYVLGGLVIGAILVGAWRSPQPGGTLPARMLGRWAAAAAASIILVIAIDVLFH